MTRREHNEHWGVRRQMTDQVCCSTIGYGELSQYDADCASCWLHHPHIWADHDRMVTAARQDRQNAIDRAARVESVS